MTLLSSSTEWLFSGKTLKLLYIISYVKKNPANAQIRSKTEDDIWIDKRNI